MGKTFSGKLILNSDHPLQIEMDGSDLAPPNKRQSGILKTISDSVKAYIKEASDLLDGKYARLKEMAPVHLANPGNVLIACCEEGLVIRFEKKHDDRRLMWTWIEKSLPDLVKFLSQDVAHCYAQGQQESLPPERGMKLSLGRMDVAKNTFETVATGIISFDVELRWPEKQPVGSQKPYCLLSLRNSFEFSLLGDLIRDRGGVEQRQPFLARSLSRLPVGWECIEVYPGLNLDQWKPEYARAWAEHDLLGAALSAQMKESGLVSLDPKAAARREFARDLSTFKKLLDSSPEREEVLQSFLRERPSLLCPAYAKMWPKLPLGKRVTDFVFQEAAGDYLLVELEPSTIRIFVQSGDLSSKTNHALGQLRDWKRYLEDNLQTAQNELGLVGISTNPKSLVVIGRANEMTAEKRRLLTTQANEIPKVSIMTYDDIYDNAKAVGENLLGPLWEPGGNTRIYYPKA